jgi:membrane associated rhomboid family serine protease
MSITLIIIIFTCLLSYSCFENTTLFNKLCHYPYEEHRDKEYLRLLTSGFLHGSWMHLGINMFVLYQFGSYVEDVFRLQLFGDLWGAIFYLAIYLLVIIIADIPTFLKHKNNASFRSVGASGAVSGLVFITILFQPWSKIYLYAVIPIYNILAGFLYLGYSYYASKNSDDNIDHEAHYYGALAGMALTIALKPDVFTIFIQKLLHEMPF